MSLERQKIMQETFELNGKTYQYFYNDYNTTGRNERKVEVPVFMDEISKHQGQRILEVGNVISHYYPVTWDVVDLYEEAPGVINQNISCYTTPDKYDFVFSVSTMEHTGYGNELIAGFDNIFNCLLKPGCEMFLSLPWAYNRDFEHRLLSGELGYARSYFMKQEPAGIFTQCTLGDLEGIKYDKPYFAGNGFVLSYLKRSWN
jgi:hypothetical protein